jgi:hypothetical protein
VVLAHPRLFSFPQDQVFSKLGRLQRGSQYLVRFLFSRGACVIRIRGSLCDRAVVSQFELFPPQCSGTHAHPSSAVQCVRFSGVVEWTVEMRVIRAHNDMVDDAGSRPSNFWRTCPIWSTSLKPNLLSECWRARVARHVSRHAGWC